MRVEAAGSPLAGAERCEVIGMNRGQIVEKILDIKREKGWTWKHIADEIGGLSPILVVGAVLGQMKLPKSVAEKAASQFGLSEGESACSTRFRREAGRCRRPIRFSIAFTNW
jgi:hypothetical protein